ncbi:3-oxo-5alpha-steroid 4-dehydrogenase [Lentzea xinjiangensis]|uniref:3-oxo-5alpha-steroid 4-dehydrogenase n=1 Tax=Lentzea xinjiangensis TaxID=402600 RepID=A0A1H9VPS5_9PSEU|nr:FAD-binding protein [Lentzea xinjiangensis]SES23592.1 3-oxo-5alpha-steroid 4-dehydrogenase [Lentzea xinjiangensis]
MEVTADVVVIGFGAAGACAAVEAAAAGASVVVLDRFAGGGATALSGGVVYAGGGTRQQVQAGVTDSVDAMEAYLRTEVRDAVSAPTLRRFCEDSAEALAWLEDRGVPFSPALSPFKTSYPTDDHYLYLSGSEDAWPDPAPRGHRTKAKGTSGKVFFARLAEAARRAGVRILPQTRALDLVVENGRVAGVRCRTLTGLPRAVHAALSRAGAKPWLYYPPLGRALFGLAARLERFGRPAVVHAGRGVVIAAGGFISNRALVREHAPLHRGGLALGTPGDDGAGIMLGVAAGGRTARMDKISVWRFITPPSALQRGVLVDADGRRFGDATRYGAAIGDEIVRRGGRAWLLVDDDVLRVARAQVKTQTARFQRWQVRYLLGRGLVTAPTVEEVAAKAGIGVPEPVGVPPYSLINVSVRAGFGYPCPMLTLGGLVVDEDTGQVRGVPALYAAGRSAVGVCSESYVSGLALADCVFSGRRAGHHVVQEAQC